DGIRVRNVTGVQTCALPILLLSPSCCDPLCRRAVRVSMGTVFQVPWAYAGHAAGDWPGPALDRLHALGFAAAAMALDDRALPVEDRKSVVEGQSGELDEPCV